MASIVKRNDSYSVVYRYESDGKKKQKWEGGLSYKEAVKRKAQIEAQMLDGSFIAPNNKTVADLMESFVNLYGLRKWVASTYSIQTSLIKNYILPLIGHWELQSITVKMVDEYFRDLATTKSAKGQTATDYVTKSNISKIHKLLKCAFDQAVLWGDVSSNVFKKTNAVEKVRSKKRTIWNTQTIKKALTECKDPILYLAINLSVACSLRVDEITGLCWEDVHISDKEIEEENAYIYIKQELQRASLEALEKLQYKDVYHVFEPVMRPNSKSRLVLKKPKTDSSIRQIWLPTTLAKMLKDWKERQDRLKKKMGRQYKDYGLVLALEDGRPVEKRVVEAKFQKLKKEANLPDVVFHSLRKSSITQKLKLSNGNIKAVQGDSGHAVARMITDIYSEIEDEDRRKNAVKFEDFFYSTPSVNEQVDDSLSAAIGALKDNPALIQAIIAIANAQKN